MADWKKLAKDLILADGYIELKETELIKKAILADGLVSKSEAEFLIELRREAPKAVAAFHQFVLDVVKKAVLADGEVSAVETAWLEKFITADGKVDDQEKQLLKDLKAGAKSTSPEFEALYKKYAS
ncbi:MAG TPA: hypothetical protein VH092_25320 [Urbifossiella sp.]|jgi:hypothetical protein|nr:hypothetical protein [Urbifossiella sp.]